jgi:hypothetical protein
LLPFSEEQFFAVFAAYNRGVWPMQWVLHGVAAAILVILALRIERRDRLVCALLAALWLWTAIAYHWSYFADINPAARVFAVAFLAEAAALFFFAAAGKTLHLEVRCDLRSLCGVGMAAFALAGYPATSVWLGHGFPAMPTFGAPCPTTIFTLGVMALARSRSGGVLLIVPLLWAAIGGSAGFLLGVWQDSSLIVSGLLVVGLWAFAGERGAKAKVNQ